MSHRVRASFWAFAIVLAQLHIAKGDILPEGLVLGNDQPPVAESAQARRLAAPSVPAALVEKALQVAGSSSATGAFSSKLRSGHNRAEYAERSSLKLDRGEELQSSHGAWAHQSGVDRLLNSSMLQVRSLSKRFPHVFAQVPMHAGTREISWLGSMAMILVVSGTVIFMVLLLFAFQEKVKKEYEPEKQSNPPLQFLRNNPEATKNFGRGAGMQVPFGPASTSSVVSHMRDPRFAAGADQRQQEVKEGSGAPWA